MLRMVLGDKFLILILFISFELPRGTHLNRGEFDQLMENWNINFSVSFFLFYFQLSLSAFSSNPSNPALWIFISFSRNRTEVQSMYVSMTS